MTAVDPLIRFGEFGGPDTDGIRFAPQPADTGGPGSLLAEFTGLWRASSLDLGTYTPGDPWPNEGTAGSAYDAIGGSGDTEPPDPGAPALVDDDGLGFAIDPTSGGLDYLYVPNGPGIEPGAGSFTMFARVKWINVDNGSFSNITTKVLGVFGAGGVGWTLSTGSAVGGTAAIVTDGTNLAFASDGSGTGLAVGEHLAVLRLDRDTDELAVFVDGVLEGTGDASALGDVTTEHQWIFGRGVAQIGRAYGLCLRALTDDEVTVTLPAALST